MHITFAVDEKVLEAARRYAAARGTTVDAILANFLSRLAEPDSEAHAARQRLVEMGRNSTWDPGPGPTWNREDI